MFQFYLSFKMKIILCLWILLQLTDGGCYGFSAKSSKRDVNNTGPPPLMPMIDHEKVITEATSTLDQPGDEVFGDENGT